MIFPDSKSAYQLSSILALQTGEIMYRAWCVATGGLVWYYLSGDTKEDFRQAAWRQDRPLPGQETAAKTHLKSLSDEDLDRQIEEIKKKRNQN